MTSQLNNYSFMSLVEALVLNHNINVTLENHHKYGLVANLNTGTKGGTWLREHYTKPENSDSETHVVAFDRYDDFPYTVNNIDDIVRFVGDTMRGRTYHDEPWRKLLIEHGILEMIETIQFKLKR